MTLAKLTFKLTGTRPLLMNNVESANPSLAINKARKEITKKRTNKTDEDVERLERLSWEAKLYLSSDDEKRIVIPSRCLKALLAHGAKKSGRGLGDKAKEAVFFESPETDLVYEGPKDLDAFYEHPGSRDVRMAVIDKKRVPVCRPRFAKWSLKASVTVDGDVANVEEVKGWLQRAETIGLGDWHYEFGAFEVTF